MLKNKKLWIILVFAAGILYFNQWLLCYPYILFYDKQFYNADLTAAEVITPDIEADNNLNNFNDKNRVLLKIDTINNNSYGVIYGRTYNRKDIKIKCNNQEAIDYHFNIDKENSRINNYPYILRYYFDCKVFLYPGWNKLQVTIGKKMYKYFVFIKTKENKYPF